MSMQMSVHMSEHVSVTHVFTQRNTSAPVTDRRTLNGMMLKKNRLYIGIADGTPIPAQ